MDEFIWGFEWIAMLMKDPECLIAAKDSPPHNWEAVFKEAEEKKGAQPGQVPPREATTTSWP